MPLQTIFYRFQILLINKLPDSSTNLGFNFCVILRINVVFHSKELSRSNFILWQAIVKFKHVAQIMQKKH